MEKDLQEQRPFTVEFIAAIFNAFKLYFYVPILHWDCLIDDVIDAILSGCNLKQKRNNWICYRNMRSDDETN